MIPEYGTPEFKAWWMETWGYTPGTPEGEAMWEEKCALMEGRHIRKAPMIFVGRDIHYESPVDGRVIRSKHERLDDLRRNNCIEYDPEMKKDANRRAREQEAALEASIDRQVEAEYERMPSRKREVLANEMAAGVTAEPVRLTANGG